MAEKDDFETLEVESEEDEGANHEALSHVGRETLGLNSENDTKSNERTQQHIHKRKSSGEHLSESRATIPRSISVEDNGVTTGSPHRRKRAKTEDEKEQRRVERLLSNRLAAEKSRERKRQEFEALKAEKEQLEQTNWDMAKRVASLENDLGLVSQENQRLKLKLRVEKKDSTTPGQKDVSHEGPQNEREELAVQWQELSEQTEMFEHEKLKFAEEIQAQRRQLEAELKEREEEIHKSHNAHKTSLLAARDKHASTLVNMLKAKDQELTQKHQHILDLDKLVALKSDALTAAEAHSASREELMKTLDALVASLESTVKSKDEALAMLEETARSKDLEIESVRLELFMHKEAVGKTAESGNSKSLPDEPVGHGTDGPHTSPIPVPSDQMEEDTVRNTPGVPRSSVTLASASPQPPTSQPTKFLHSVSWGPSHSPAAATSRIRSVFQGQSKQLDQPENGQSEAEDSQADEDPILDAPHDLRRATKSRRRTRANNSDRERRSPRQISSEVKKTKRVKEREKRDQEEEEFSVIDHDDGSKPGHSYTQLIGMAIVESPDRQLRLAEIYKWISDTYSFYSVDVPMRKDWKNAIRSTLSTNKKFVRQWRNGEDPGKGSYWGLRDPSGEDEFIGRPIYMKARSSWHRIGRMKTASS